MVRRILKKVPAPEKSATLDERELMHRTNAALDELFRSSPAGPLPWGNLSGTLVAFPGTALARPLARLTYLIAWQGKVMDGRQETLKNKVTPVRLRAVKARVGVADSWVDAAPCVLIDYSRTSWVARMVRDEVRLVAPQLYLGVIWLWRRRVGWFTLREPRNASRDERTDSRPAA
jgi:hypothetical protein